MSIWYPPPFYNFIEKDFRSHAASTGSYSHALCFWGCNGLIQTLRIKEFQAFYARLCHRLNTWAKFLAGGHELSISNLASGKVYGILQLLGMSECRAQVASTPAIVSHSSRDAVSQRDEAGQFLIIYGLYMLSVTCKLFGKRFSNKHYHVW